MTKTNTRSRIVSILLVLMMLLTMVPITAVTASAAEPEWTTVNTYEEWKAAMEQSGETYIKLGADIDTSTLNGGFGLGPIDWVRVQSDIHLDLNGHKLTLLKSKMSGDSYSYLIGVLHGSLTIEDTGNGGEIVGLHQVTNDRMQLIDVGKGAKLTLNSGKLRLEVNADSNAPNATIRFKGAVEINGGTVSILKKGGKDEPSSYIYKQNFALEAIRESDNCYALINGGTFDGRVMLKAVAKASGVANNVITGGDFKKSIYILKDKAVTGDVPLNVSIQGGTYHYTPGYYTFPNSDPFNAGKKSSDPFNLMQFATFGFRDGIVYQDGAVYSAFPSESSYLNYDMNAFASMFPKNAIITAEGQTYDFYDTRKDAPTSITVSDAAFTGSSSALDLARLVNSHYKTITVTTLPSDALKDMKLTVGDGTPLPAQGTSTVSGDVTLGSDGTLTKTVYITALGNKQLKEMYYSNPSKIDFGYRLNIFKDGVRVTDYTGDSLTYAALGDEISVSVQLRDFEFEEGVYTFRLALWPYLRGSEAQIGENLVGLWKLTAKEEPPAPVAHSIKIINGFGTANPTTAIAGETVTVKANDRTADNMMFTQWYTETTTIKARTYNHDASADAEKWGPLATATFTKYSDTTLPKPTITPEGMTYTGSITAYLTAPALDGVKLEYQLVAPGEEPSDTQWHEYDPQTGITVNKFGTSVLCARSSKSYDAETPGGQYYVATITSETATATYTRTYSAAIDNVTVGGKVGKTMTQDVVIRMNGDRFENVTAGDDVSAWFNLPAGLTAKVKELSDANGYHRTLTVTISGMPTATSADAITVTIPKDKLYANNTTDLTVLSNPNAVYNIVKDGTHTHNYGDWTMLDDSQHSRRCTACGDVQFEAHDFSAWRKVDDTNHSRTCSKCKKSGETANYTETAAHTWVWVVDQEAALGQPGKQHEECVDCPAKRSENTEIPALRDYAVTVTGGTATVAAGTPITRAMEGVEVTVTAQAPDGKHFVKWVVKAGGITLANETSATTTFTMPANDVTIEAEFAENPVEAYTLTVIKGTASVAAGTPITDKIEQNTVVTVTANAPETGKVFDKWVVLEGNVTLADATKATTTFTMPASAVKIEATYKDAPPAHTHSYGTEWKYDGTNHWHECACGDKADTAAHSFQWVIDKAATKEATGIKHEECTVCGAKRSENTVIDKLPDGGNTGNTGSGDNNTDKPGKDDSTKPPQTGDSRNLIGWLAALFVCGGVLTVLGLNSKKRKESEAE